MNLNCDVKLTVNEHGQVMLCVNGGDVRHVGDVRPDAEDSGNSPLDAVVAYERPLPLGLQHGAWRVCGSVAEAAMWIASRWFDGAEAKRELVA